MPTKILLTKNKLREVTSRIIREEMDILSEEESPDLVRVKNEVLSKYDNIEKAYNKLLNVALMLVKEEKVAASEIEKFIKEYNFNDKYVKKIYK